MAEFNKPTLDRVWGITGTLVAPDSAKIEAGWNIEAPPYEYFNWLDNRQDSFMFYINQHGIPEWDSVTEYIANKSYVVGSNGVLYQAKTTNTGINPVNDTTNTHWKRAFVASDAYGAPVELSKNFSDVPNKATARTNLGLKSAAVLDVGTGANQVVQRDSTGAMPGNITGNAPTAGKWLTARTLTLSGDGSASGAIDGSANVALTFTLANTGVTPGTHAKVTVDAKGRVTSGTTLSASDIPTLAISKISGLQTALDAKALAANVYTKDEVYNKTEIDTQLAGLSSGGDVDLANYYTKAEVNTSLDGKVDKATGKGLSTEDYTSAEKTKLAGIASGANNYTHPSNHPASIITQDANNRFVTDTEKATWNAKAGTALATTSANGLMASGDKTKLDGIASGANNYVHPSSHPASIITQDASNRFVTDTEKATWNSKAEATVATTSANGLMSSADKTKLNGIASGAQVNQNAFSNIAVSGQTTVAADSTTDTLTLVAGANVSLTTNATSDSVTIAVTGVAPITHNHDAATTSVAGFMSAADKTKLNGIAAGANNYVHPSSHPANIITQDANNRFVTDTEKAAWNAKASTAVATTSANGLMSAADKTKLDGFSGTNITTEEKNKLAKIGIPSGMVTLGDSSTDVLLAGNVKIDALNSTDNIISNNTTTGNHIKRLFLQGGDGTGSTGGRIVLYGSNHVDATYAGGMTLKAYSGGYVRIGTDAYSDQMTFYPSGRVKIGHTGSDNGVDLLQVVGTVSCVTLKVSNVAGTRANLGLGDAATRNIYVSTGAPTSGDGVDGDIWLEY